MKILLTASHEGLHTGSSIQLGILARELVKRGHDVTALFKRPDDPSWPLNATLEPLVKAGVRVDRFRFRGLGHADNIAEILRLRRFIKAEKFDVVHCFKGTDFDFITLASPGVAIPALIVTRGNGMPLDVFNSVKYRLKKVKAIITVCEELKRIVVTTGGVKPEKVVVIYGGVNLDLFNRSIDGALVRDELAIPRDAPVVGIVGSIDFRRNKDKGGYEFAHAARMVLDRKSDTRFLCVGDINTEYFRPLGEELKITDRFVFAGFRTDVPRMFAAMDVSVCSSLRGEGLTGTLIESLAIGVPAVSADVGGNREIVRDGQTGFIVKPADNAAMAEKILTLLNDPQMRRRMGESGRALVEDLCDFHKQVDRIEALYKKSLGKLP